jgi:hypothetical protein
MNGKMNTPKVMDTEDWRVCFKRLLKKFPKSKTLYRELSTVDDLYQTAEGKQELDNVKYDRAGFGKTVRAVKTLEKWFELQKGSKIQKIIKRHKLTVPAE